MLAEFLKGIGDLFRKLWDWVFVYPVIIDYVDQFETRKGYVFIIEIYTVKNRVVQIPKNTFKIKIRVDPARSRKMKGKLDKGEYVDVYESEALLQASIDNRSFGNVSNYVGVHKNPQSLFLLTRVQGPGSQNPSLRLQLGRVYQTVKIKLRKRFLSLTYIEIPIRQVPIISGNEKTHIVDS